MQTSHMEYSLGGFQRDLFRESRLFQHCALGTILAVGILCQQFFPLPLAYIA